MWPPSCATVTIALVTPPVNATRTSTTKPIPNAIGSPTTAMSCQPPMPPTRHAR